MLSMLAPRARALLYCLLSASSRAVFYLPGVAPHDFAIGETIELHVNKLTSVKTQLPYDYYYLPYCRPHNVAQKVRGHSLGEMLSDAAMMIGIHRGPKHKMLKAKWEGGEFRGGVKPFSVGKVHAPIVGGSSSLPSGAKTRSSPASYSAFADDNFPSKYR